MSTSNKAFFEKYIDPQVKEIDRVNVYEFENGMDYELLQLGGEITHENIKKAQAKVLKNLKTDATFYTNKIAEETIKLVGNWGGGGKSGKYSTKEEAENLKADTSKSSGETVKVDKDNQMSTLKKNDVSSVKKDSKITPNYNPKVKEMTNKPYKGPGIKRTMDMPGRERTIKLKENYVPLKDRPVPSQKELDAEWEARKGQFKSSMKDQLKMKKEDVQVQDSRKIRLTPEVKQSIASFIKEALFKNNTNPKDIRTAVNPQSQQALTQAGFTKISGTDDVK